MKTTHPALWAAGLAGVATGTALAIIGVIGSGDVAGLSSGYGTMLIGSALYLLAGLKLRERFSRRSPAAMATAEMSRTDSITSRS